MLDYLNDVFSVLSAFVSFIFSLEFLPGVSIGSVFLVASLLYAISVTLWPRR